MRHSSRGVKVDWVRVRDEAGISYELRTPIGSLQTCSRKRCPKGRRSMGADLQNASRSVVQKFLAIFCRADSAHPAEHPGKVLLRFEAAAHRDIQNTRLGRAQHFLIALYSMTQNKVMRALAGDLRNIREK